LGANVLGGSSANLPDADFAPGESITVNFGHFVNAVGIFFTADSTVAQNGDYFVRTGAGDQHQNLGPPQIAGPNNAGLFFVGLISDTPFNSATFGTTVNTVGADARGFFVLDNLTVSQEVPIPAPAGLVVFGSLVAVAGFGLRRRRAT
jgi:hypothetical protein